MMRRKAVWLVAAAAFTLFWLPPVRSAAAPSQLGPGVGTVPQGTQSDSAFAASFAANGVTNVDATAAQTSCYRPEVPYAAVGTAEGYSGETACTAGEATTGEDTGAAGPYPTQLGSNPGYPASGPMLVKDHSESDIRVDPTNPLHLIASVKWFVSAEGYNHALGFYESFDGGLTWPVQGHIPGYEGWTDNTDPVGAFDPSGNYYELILPYQFFYDPSGGHDFRTNPNLEPQPALPAEAIAIAVRPHSALTCSPTCPSAQSWITHHAGQLDLVASYDQFGNEPDKQWITIDDVSSQHSGRIYSMWVDFHALTPVPFVSFADANADGTHTDWSPPQRLPQGADHPQGDTYLLPHVAPDGTVYTTITNFEPERGFCCVNIDLDKSTDGGVTWTTVSRAVSDVVAPGSTYANTTFRDGINDTFTVGPRLVNGHYPLYLSYEDNSAGVVNVMLTASFDGGSTWSAPIQVNDNASKVDEFQPNLAAAADGTVSVAFYDRRLACPAQGTAEAAGAGLALDTANPDFSGSLPPYGATNYCVNSAIQFYQPSLTPIGHNVRVSSHTWDGELNSPHTAGIGRSVTFIGDYFGNIADGATEVITSVSTFNEGTNPANRQQQVVAELPVP